MVQAGIKYEARSAPLNVLIRQFLDIRSRPELEDDARLRLAYFCWRELTPLNCERQFKPFLNLTG